MPTHELSKSWRNDVVDKINVHIHNSRCHFILMTNATLVYFIPVGLIFMQNFICYTIYLVIANDFDYLWNICTKPYNNKTLVWMGWNQCWHQNYFILKSRVRDPNSLFWAVHKYDMSISILNPPLAEWLKKRIKTTHCIEGHCF